MLSNCSSSFQAFSSQHPRGPFTPETRFSRITHGTKAFEAGIALSSSLGSWNTGLVAGGLLCDLPDRIMFLAQTNEKQTENRYNFHGKLFMNHVLQHNLGTANVHFICMFYLQIHPLLFEVCHMCIFTNGQQVRRCNLLNFFDACNPTGPCNHFVFSNS